MIKGWFPQLFPPPDFLLQAATGLDVSDLSLKYSRLRPRHGRLAVTQFGEQTIPAGLIESGQIKNRPQLGAVFRALRTRLPSPYLLVSLPEEHAFILRLSLPHMAIAELRGSIELQLEQHVPLRADEAVFDYEIIRPAAGPGEHFELAVTVFPKQIMADYHATLTEAGFQPLAYEVEAQAMARAVLPQHQRQTVMLIDFGKTRTSLFVVQKDSVLFTATLTNIGGHHLTQAIQKNLQISETEARDLKETRGLLGAGSADPLLAALMPIVSVLRDEITKIYNYWNTHNEESERQHQPIERLVLGGGQATLPGLLEYLAAGFTIPISLSNVWTNIMTIGRTIPPISFNLSQKYATSLGLALRQYYD